MIQDVILQPLKQIVDERGKVMHMIRRDSEHFQKFGEIYFSVVNPNTVKAWKKHLKMTQNLTVPIGKIKMVIFDDRDDSKTKGQVQEIELGEDNYSLLIIPPNLWYGFAGISKEAALIANCSDMTHDPDEVVRLADDSEKIPFNWSK